MSSRRVVHASDAIRPRPPEFVTIPTLRLRGSGWRSSRSAASNSASVLSTRSTPAWRSSASTAASSPSAPAVCDAAATGSRPRLPFTARIGFSRETRRESCENRRGLPNDSTYSAITVHRGSSAQYSSRSFVETSARLPSETNAATPSPRAAAWPSSASPSAPDCDDSARPPGRALTSPSSACSATAGSLLKRPMLFGPTSRTPRARTASSSASSRSRPSGSSVSEKPADDDEHAARARVGRLDHRVEHLGGRDGDDRELGRVGQVAGRRYGAHRGHDPAAPAHRRRDAGEAARDDPPQELGANAALARRRAHHRHRLRREHRSQRGDRGAVHALGHRLRRPLARADVELEVRLAERGLAADVEAGAREDAEHAPVVGEHLGVEAAHAALGPDLRELLEHPRRPGRGPACRRRRRTRPRRRRARSAGRSPRPPRPARRGARSARPACRRPPARSRARRCRSVRRRGSACSGSRPTGRRRTP